MRVVLVAIVVLVAVLSWWMRTVRAAARRTQDGAKVYGQLLGALHEVRRLSAKIDHLLRSQQSANFATDIVETATSFSHACDTLQHLVGSHRAVVGRRFYGSVVTLIAAASKLIGAVNRGMSGTLPPEQVARELMGRSYACQQQLRHAEKVLIKEIQRYRVKSGDKGFISAAGASNG